MCVCVRVCVCYYSNPFDVSKKREKKTIDLARVQLLQEDDFF